MNIEWYRKLEAATWQLIRKVVRLGLATKPKDLQQQIDSVQRTLKQLTDLIIEGRSKALKM